MNEPQLNFSALASVEIQKTNKEKLADISGLALDPGAKKAVYKTSGSIFWALCPESSLTGPSNRDILWVQGDREGGCHGTEKPCKH